jgi:hypothetical protein
MFATEDEGLFVRCAGGRSGSSGDDDGKPEKKEGEEHAYAVAEEGGEALWMESGLDGTYEELWAKQIPAAVPTTPGGVGGGVGGGEGASGGERSLVLRSRNGLGLLVVQGNRFGLAVDARGAKPGSGGSSSSSSTSSSDDFHAFVSGQVEDGVGLVVDCSADRDAEGCVQLLGP